jgi:hypothetical protein
VSFSYIIISQFFCTLLNLDAADIPAASPPLLLLSWNVASLF